MSKQQPQKPSPKLQNPSPKADPQFVKSQPQATNPKPDVNVIVPKFVSLANERLGEE